MSDQINKIKIFVASPNDVQSERNQLDDVVRELNSTICKEKKIVLEMFKWETNCYPAMGRVQGVINKQVGSYDIFIGIMWKRFGTPTGISESGTEEEFRCAYSMWKENHTPHILFYFCMAPFMPRTKEEADQISKVIAFRDELSKIGLTGEYTESKNFSNVVRPQLFNLLSDMFNQPRKDSQNLLHQFWNNLDDDLQDAFALAYNQSRRDGISIIKTKTLFAAMMKLNREPLNDLFRLLPEEALPNPICENSIEKQYILNENPDFSGCVADSLENFSKHKNVRRKLSSEDIFVDIAKHGTGSSVARLRTHGISAKKIDQIVTQLGWKVIER